MYTIALIAQKGGTGKTTLAKSLAVAASNAGLVALIIDLDPQSSACNWKDRRQEAKVSDTPVVIDAQPPRLAAALLTAEQNGVDFVVIDTPARLSESALAAAKCADLVLIPCRPQDADLDTIPSTCEIISLAGQKPAMVILNAVPPTGDRHEQAKNNLARYQLPVCPFTIGNRVAFGDASALGKTPQEYDPRGKASEEILQVYNYTFKLLEELKAKENHGNQQAGSFRVNVKAR